MFQVKNSENLDLSSFEYNSFSAVGLVSCGNHECVCVCEEIACSESKTLSNNVKNDNIKKGSMR